MTTQPTVNTLEPLVRAVVAATTGASATDAELLSRFIDHRDEAAFAVLVHRHGPMVFGLCRRLLPNEADAEDVFQATFLVLALKAASVAPRETVAAWLHGVARQVALRARRSLSRRAARERQVNTLPEPESVPRDDYWDDLLPVLDRELGLLPDRYRTVLVLCDLEGVTRQEAGRQLGLPEGTVNSRLSRARAMLTNRLTRCGVVLPNGALVAVLAQGASACVPASVMAATIRVAVLAAEAGTAATGGVSAGVANLTEGVARAMFVTKLKAVVAVVLLLGFIAAGATALSVRSASAWGNQPPATEPKVNAPPRPEPELDRPGVRPDLAGTWQGDDWGTVVLRAAKDGGFEGTYSSTFGKDTGRIAVRWSAASRRYEGTWSEGTYRFGRIALDAPKDGTISGAYTTDPKCEHQPGVPSLASLRWNKKQEKEKDKEAFTAWGKEVNGLQAGLGYTAGEKRAYSYGETVKVVVRVRNVGKEEVEFKHIWAFFVENPPTITDADGKRVQLPGLAALGLHLPRTTTVAPGKEVELFEWGFDLRPKGEGGKNEWATIHGVGKFSLQCERVVGPTLSNPNHPNPALDKLATGKLELEVKEAKKPEKPDQEKEAFTAWGKEVDGVQAGLGYLPGAKRVYTPGETVRLVVRVRNGGKKDVKISYSKEFFKTPPTVTDGAGKTVTITHEEIVLSFTRSVEVNLAPGQEIDLCELNLPVRSTGEKGQDRPWGVSGAGQFHIQFERVGSDTVLSKLATGKLELDVKSVAADDVTEKK